MSNLIGTLSRYGVTPQSLIRSGEVILIVLIAVSLAGLVWDLIPLPGNGGSVQHSIQDGSSDIPQIQTVPIDAQSLPGVSRELRELFGKTTAQSEAIMLIDGPVQETQLNLVLKGILADSDTDKKVALIARGTQKEEVYQVGDRIEGAEIINIESRRVILRRNGVTEALNLEALKLQGVNSGLTSTQRGLAFGKFGIQKIGDNNRVVPHATLRQQLNNLPQLLQQAKTVPYIENGKQSGFRVTGIQSDSVFQELGIEQEDIIRSVNGIPVRTVEEALSAYRSLKTASVFNLDLLRQGREVTINFSIQ